MGQRSGPGRPRRLYQPRGRIDQWQLNGGMNQQWRINVGSYYSTISNAASNLMLADPSSDQSNGTVVIQYQPDGGTEQGWILLAAGNASAQTYYVANGEPNPLLHGLPDVLADPSGSTQSGTNLVVYQPLNNAEQSWTFVQLADSNYLIVNEASGDVVDGSGGTISGEEAAIYQSQINGLLGQEWQLDVLYQGPLLNYSSVTSTDLINASSGYALDETQYNICLAQSVPPRAGTRTGPVAVRYSGNQTRNLVHATGFTVWRRHSRPAEQCRGRPADQPGDHSGRRGREGQYDHHQ